jgi:hypothetical protein
MRGDTLKIGSRWPCEKSVRPGMFRIKLIAVDYWCGYINKYYGVKGRVQPCCKVMP